MAITDKEQGVWELDQVYNKINQGSIWEYTGQNEVWGMGRNENGQLGVNNKTAYSSPVQIPGNWLGHFSQGSGAINGAIMFVGKETAGTLWSWGQGWGGALGHNNQTSYSSPKQVGSDATWAHVVAAGYTLGTKTDGTLWSWGYNNYGQLGQNQGPGGATWARSSPMQIGTGTDWSTDGNKICAGTITDSYAIKTNGTLWSWGRNESGQLGVNDQTARSSPTQVGTDTTWSKLSNGNGAIVGCIKTDGTLWTWGANSNGLLGHNEGPGDPYSSPKQVGTGTDWNAITYVPGIARAVKTDGTMWVWGNNNIGQLGLSGDKTLRSSPTQLPGTWSVEMAGSHPSSFGNIKADGTLWSWGYNEYGVLGQNDRTEYSSPRQVGTGTDWVQMCGGSNALFATIKK